MGLFKKLHDKVTAPDVKLALKLSNYTVVLGDNLEGSLDLNSTEDFECEEVRCEIECIEQAKVTRYQYDATIKRSIPREFTESSVLFAAKPPLNGSIHISNGENRRFPIKISIPPGSRPTYQAIDRKVNWTIKGVVAVKGRPDATTQVIEIQVIQPTPIVASQQTVKEVVRVIVKIPCEYCQTLFDQLETSCPNCGAKRKA
jgi:hypothetical protein